METGDGYMYLPDDEAATGALEEQEEEAEEEEAEADKGPARPKAKAKAKAKSKAKAAPKGKAAAKSKCKAKAKSKAARIVEEAEDEDGKDMEPVDQDDKATVYFSQGHMDEEEVPKAGSSKKSKKSKTKVRATYISMNSFLCICRVGDAMQDKVFINLRFLGSHCMWDWQMSLACVRVCVCVQLCAYMHLRRPAYCDFC